MADQWISVLVIQAAVCSVAFGQRDDRGTVRPDTTYLVHGLMDDAGLANDANLDGAWFAAPSPSARRAFEKRYGDVYGIKPLRLASLAYDATALAAILARSSFDETGAPSYDYNALTNPNGFSGVDGIFRFRPDGISERGLAVLEFQNGSIKVVDEAPETFQRDAF